MLQKLLVFSLGVWSLFHLWNCGAILAPAKEWVDARAPVWLIYLLSCSYCFGFWCSCAVLAVSPWFYPICVPALVLLLELAYLRLEGGHE
jgi:hypothetical protein